MSTNRTIVELLQREQSGVPLTHGDLENLQKLPAPSPRPIHTIAVFYHRFFCGGVERVISEQFRHLLGGGYRVVLITEIPAAPKDFPIPEGVVRELIPAQIDGRADALRNIFEKHQIDVYYTHASFAPQTLWDLLIVRFLLNRRVIVHAHGIFPCSLVWGENDLERRRDLYALADEVIVLCRADEFYYRTFGLRCRYIPNPVTKIPRYDLPIDARWHSRLVLSVGRICSVKQTLDVLRTAEIVRRLDPTIHFLVVGSREDRTYWNRVHGLYRRLGLGATLDFMDYTTDVEHVYRRGSVLLVTSQLEGFPMVMAEAKGHGIPVVSYEMPYVEFMRQPDSGVLTAPQGDVDGLAVQIVQLLGDRAFFERMSRQSRDSYDQMVDDVGLAQAYDEVMKEVSANAVSRTVEGCADARVAFQALLQQMSVALQVAYARGYRMGTESVGASCPQRVKPNTCRRALTWPFRMAAGTVRTLRNQGWGIFCLKVRQKVKALKARFSK